MTDLDAGFDGSLQDAGGLIEQMIAPQAEAEAAPERPRGPDGKFLKVKPDEDTEEAPAPSEEPSDVEEPSADEETDDGEEVRPEEGEKEVAKIKVKVDGIEQELPLDEVAKGYSRTADYTRKTQALAEERKRFESEEVAPLRSERSYYAERISAIEEALAALVPNETPDWNTLRQQLDPEQFQRAWVEWDANTKRLAVVRAEKERVAQQQQQDESRRIQRTLAEEHEKLKAALPEFADAEKGQQLKADLIAYAKSKGYTDDDLAGVTDHRVLVMLDKARRWDEAQLRKPKIEEKVDRALATIKPVGAKPRPKTTEIERAKTRLKQGGRVEDAAALINAMI